MRDTPAAALALDDEYARLLADLRAIIAAGRGRAAAAINRELVATYWSVGERIVREEQGGAARAAYGEQTLAQLGRALSLEFGQGFGARALRAMRQFYLAYPIRHAVRAGLGWTHGRALLRLPGQISPYDPVHLQPVEKPLAVSSGLLVQDRLGRRRAPRSRQRPPAQPCCAWVRSSTGRLALLWTGRTETTAWHAR